jgi:hypothetical protein
VELKPENWIAIYAAVVGTAAFFLNFRTWFEKRARLSLSLMPDAVLTGTGRTEKGFMAVTVINRGGQTITLTHLVLLRFSNRWKRWRVRPSESYFVPNPQVSGTSTGTIPFELEPGKKWTGLARKQPDLIPNIQNGTYYFAIYATHRDRPQLIRIPKERPPKLPPNTKTLPP